MARRRTARQTPETPEDTENLAPPEAYQHSAEEAAANEAAIAAIRANTVDPEPTSDAKAEAKKAKEARKAKEAKREAKKDVKYAEARARRAKARRAKTAVSTVDDTDAKFFASIKPQVKEITARLDNANTAEGKADDLRLSAAQIMAVVEAKFLEAKPKDVKFKDWCETNGIVAEGVKGRSWENLRKLLTVGKSDNPVAALEDMRAENAAANKRARDRVENPSPSRSRDQSDDGSGSEPRPSVVVSPVDMVQSIVNSLVSQRDIDTLIKITDIIVEAIDKVEIANQADIDAEEKEAVEQAVDFAAKDAAQEQADIDAEEQAEGNPIPDFLNRNK